MPTARVGDLDIHYELADYTDPWRAGAETFLLYHGYARNLTFWQNWVALLARDYRVLRFDARGCGETTKPAPGTRYTIDQLAADAIGLMDHLGLDRVHWVGESSGGIIGLAAALAHPERLASLTLCNTPFRIPEAVVDTYAVGEADQGSAIEKHGVGGWCRLTLPYRLDVTQAPPELGDWYCAEMDKTPKHVAIALHEVFAGGDFWPRLSEVRVPTLILAGENSPIARREQMEQMRQRLPSARLQIFAGYGHGINLIAPERCVAEIRAFLGHLRESGAEPERSWSGAPQPDPRG
ncbi:MAG TPA: alpha/beta hydrolase [Dehalococcoidia bacterium]|nr:alpha/beta hydrolase [Dehalococcoidia bacterium]